MASRGADGELIKSKSESVTVLIQDKEEDDGDVESKVEGESIRASRCSSLAWSESVAATIKDFGNKGGKFRGLERRSSVENFGQFGFLVPALALFPLADGVSIYMIMVLLH